MPDDHTTIRILYMEDDAGLARLLGSRLEREGYRVDLARNGSEGLVSFGSYRDPEPLASFESFRASLSSDSSSPGLIRAASISCTTCLR